MLSKEPQDRRDFIKGLGVAGAAAALPAALEAQTLDTQPNDSDYDVDVLVCGSGNGGMSAALAAAAGGAKTLMIEISTQIGGNTLMSGGLMHTSGQRTWEAYNQYTRGFHDPVLAKVYVETFWNKYIPWLQSHDAYMERRDPDAPGWLGDWWLGRGESGLLRNKLYFDSLVAAYEKKGGAILRKTRVRKLYTDEEGQVFGARAETWNTSPREENQKSISIRAKKTILAIGGFILDGEKKQKYFGGTDGYFSQSYCGPFTSGEGIEMAQAAGAALSKKGWSSFSSRVPAITATPALAFDPDRMLHLWATVAPEDWSEPYDVGRREAPEGWSSGDVVPWSPTVRGIMINNFGERFVDEAGEVYSAYRRPNKRIIEQPGGYVWAVADQDIYDATPGAESTLNAIIKEGGNWGTHGNVVIADTLEQFAEAMMRAGVHKGALLQTLKNYNEAVDARTTELLPMPRSAQNDSGRWAIRKPKFYAVPVTVSPYIIWGGVRIDEDARALDAQGKPVPNLYAPPPLGGGVQDGRYMGAIALAGTFGYLAGKHAAASIVAAPAAASKAAQPPR